MTYLYNDNLKIALEKTREITASHVAITDDCNQTSTKIILEE